MLPGSSSQALSDTLAHEIERWPGLMQGRRFGDSVEEYFVGVTVLESEIELSLKSFAESASAADRRK
jgi:hypothetical protein